MSNSRVMGRRRSIRRKSISERKNRKRKSKRVLLRIFRISENKTFKNNQLDLRRGDELRRKQRDNRR